MVVRTTAYTHTEADHIVYGNKNAIGTALRFDRIRSAAADWSRFPLGTVFRIKGIPQVHVIDDYGSALVGGGTIDLYQPSRQAMNQWGVRHVEIEILRWGSFEKSLEILRERTKYAHIRHMVRDIEQRVFFAQSQLPWQNGFFQKPSPLL